MWPFQKHEETQKSTESNDAKEIAKNYRTYLYQRLEELNNTVNALIAENRIDRDIPDKIQVISGQYREISRRLQKIETNMQPVWALIRNLREFIHPVPMKTREKPAGE